MKHKFITVLAAAMTLFFTVNASASEKITSVSISVNETKAKPGLIWTTMLR